MRILLLNHNLVERGTYFRAWHIAAGLAKRGWEVTFATVSDRRLYRSSVFDREGVTVIERPRWTWPGLEADDGWGPLSVAAGNRAARDGRYDWVYSFSHAPNCLTPARTAILRGARLVVDWCDDYAGGVFPQREALRRSAPRRRFWKWAIQRAAERTEARDERAILLQAEKVTAISGELLEKAVGFGVSRERILLARSGAELDLFRPRPAIVARERLGLPPRVPLLAYVANYHPDEKFLFDALEIVFAREPAARLLCAGPGFTDRRAMEAAFKDRLILRGRIPHERIPEVLAAGDLSLIPLADTPHNRARCPQKLMDCLAAGRPMVVCAVGEAGRIVAQNPGIGIACEPTPEAFAESILQILKAPLPEREAMSARARAVAESGFSWDRVSESLNAFLCSS